MIVGILLAAGMSRRMGEAKMLLSWRGKPLVRHLAEVACASELDAVLVVTGFAAPAVTAALAGVDVGVVHNAAYAQGQSGSVVAGVAALPSEATGALIMLVDQPLITSGLLNELVAAHRLTPDKIIAPTYAGQRGNPVVFPRTVLPALLGLSGDMGARQIIQADPQRLRLLPVTTPAIVQDADTPAAYKALLDWDQNLYDET